MNKKIFLLVLVIALVAVIAVSFAITNKEENVVSNTTNNDVKVNVANEVVDNNVEKSKKGLVLYFSATGTTEKIAEYIKEATDSDIAEIIPEEEYTDSDLNYNNENCRANIEQNDDSARPAILNEINTDYDVIYLGYPIWWGNTSNGNLTITA